MIKKNLLAAGVDNVQLLSDYGNPVIYAEKNISSSGGTSRNVERNILITITIKNSQ